MEDAVPTANFVAPPNLVTISIRFTRSVWFFGTARLFVPLYTVHVVLWKVFDIPYIST